MAWVQGARAFSSIAIDLAIVVVWGIIDSRAIAPARWPTFRPWCALALIPVAYWQADRIITAPPHGSYELSWIALDVRILTDWGLQTAIEASGRIVPALLELAYACVYVAPVVTLGLVRWLGDDTAIERFLGVLLLGTLAAYSLLPLFPSSSPRVAFPSIVPPPVDTPIRYFNIWVLEHLDIAGSVFPSGHVAAVWSTVFGARLALRARWLTAALAVFAAVTTLATLYGRYHYAVDALAGTSIAVAALWLQHARLHTR